MRPVSDTYREAIQLHRTRGVRNQMHVEVSFGLFADGAKEDSTYLISPGVSFSDADNMYHGESPATTSYVMWEKDCFRLDGVQTFLPNSNYAAQGYVSTVLADPNGLFSSPPTITVSFGQHYSVVGLSFLFDETAGLAPTQVNVKTYDGEALLEDETASNNGGAEFKPEFMLDNFDGMAIRFTHGKPYQRLRLTQLLFGVGYIYRGDDIISSRHKRVSHPLSLSLPQNELQFTLFNEDGRYDIDTDNSVVRFFQKEQKILVRYGYDVSGVGDIEWFDAGIFYLETWDVKGSQATFTARDIFYKLTQTMFYKDWFGADLQRTMAQKAAAVLEDAGITNYYVNQFIAQYTSWLPLPYASHAECLQLLANATQSTLDQDDDGKITMRYRATTPPANWYIELRPQGYTIPQMPFSTLEGVIRGADTIEYAMWEQNQFALDGSLLFVPESGGYLNSGLVENIFPDTNGNYVIPGTSYLSGLWIDFTQNQTFGQLDIEFSESNRNTRVLVIANRSGAGEVWRKYYDVNGINLNITELFDNIIWLTIYPLGSTVQQRLRLKRISVSTTTGVELTHTDVLGMTKEELAPSVKDVVVSDLQAMYWPSYTFELMRVMVTPGQLTEVKHPEVYYNMSASSENVNVHFDVQDHYAHTSFIQISGVASETEIILSGANYANPTQKYTKKNLNDTGQDAEHDNPIINSALSQFTAEWLEGYYSNRKLYEIETLGYPEVDACDRILFEGKPVIVLENIIENNQGALRGKMKLRGAGNAVDDT